MQSNTQIHMCMCSPSIWFRKCEPEPLIKYRGMSGK